MNSKIIYLILSFLIFLSIAMGTGTIKGVVTTLKALTMKTLNIGK